MFKTTGNKVFTVLLFLHNCVITFSFSFKLAIAKVHSQSFQTILLKISLKHMNRKSYMSCISAESSKTIYTDSDLDMEREKTLRELFSSQVNYISIEKSFKENSPTARLRRVQLDLFIYLSIYLFIYFVVSEFSCDRFISRLFFLKKDSKNSKACEK